MTMESSSSPPPSSSPSSPSLSDLQKDICTDILTRLDSKSLSRFKLVSKSWFLFVSDPCFSRFYSMRRGSITGFFYRSSSNYHEKIRFVSIDDREEDVSDPSSSLGFLESPAVLYNSCNGLLHWFSSWDSQFVSNPLTKKAVGLPWPIPAREFFASGIAFDPCQWEHFQVAVLFFQPGSSLLLSRVFSSETMQWGEAKETLELPQEAKPYRCLRGVFLNGCIYWELINNVILVHDVKAQSSRTINSPLADDPGSVIPYEEPACLGFFFGRLQYCRVIGSRLVVWDGSQNCSSDDSNTSFVWVMKHRIELFPLMFGDHGSGGYGCEALAILPRCEGVLVGVTGKIVALRFGDSAIVDVCEVHRNAGDYIRPSMFFPFVHSLALFNLS